LQCAWDLNNLVEYELNHLSTYLNTITVCNPCQEAVSLGESNITDLKKSLETQQSERAKAELSLKSPLENIEKIKANFDVERATWETEKATLLKREEDAEAQLKPVTEELSGLKQHISQMTAAIFGK
jgi:chromosome segregation ATPase